MHEKQKEPKYKPTEVKYLDDGLVGQRLEISGTLDKEKMGEEGLFNVMGVGFFKFWYNGVLSNHESDIPIRGLKSFDITFAEDKIYKDQNLAKDAANKGETITVIGKLEEGLKGTLFFRAHGLKTDDVESLGYQMNICNEW